MEMMQHRLAELHGMLDEIGYDIDTPLNEVMPHLRNKFLDILDERHAIACHLGDLGENIEEVEREVNELRIPHVLDGSMDPMEDARNVQRQMGQDQGCHEMDALPGGMNMDWDGYTPHNSGQNNMGYQNEAVPESNQNDGCPPQLEQQVWDQEEDPLDMMGGLEGLL